MTKKDYELIARVIREVSAGLLFGQQKLQLIEDFAEALAQTNPKFNRERFKEACK